LPRGHHGGQGAEVASHGGVSLRSIGTHGIANSLVDLINGGISNDAVQGEDATDGILVKGGIAGVASAGVVVDLCGREG